MIDYPSPNVLPVRESGAARWVHLDVLRAVAILLVLGPHTPFRLPEESGGRILFEAWRHIGWVGVDLFFVLSGFLIGGLLFAEQRKYGGIRFGRFFIRRTFKIWPSYLVFLAAAFAWDVRAGSGSLGSRLRDSAHSIWPYLIHIQNYYSPLVDSIGHAWSLAVEEHFYLLLPLLLYLMGRWARRRSAAPFQGLPWICVLLAMTCLGLRFYLWQGEEQFDEFKNHWPTHLQIDSLFIGVTLAYGVHFARPRIEALRRWRWLILIASLACFAPFTWVFGKSTFACTIGYTLLAVGSMGLVLVAWFASVPAPGRTPSPTRPPGVVRRAGSLLVNVLAMIGARSYSIYLWHMPFTVPVVLKLQAHLGFWEWRWHYAMMAAVYTVVAVGFGSIMYALIEAPGVILRDRWFPSKPRKDAQCYPISFDPPRALGPADDLRPIS